MVIGYRLLVIDNITDAKIVKKMILTKKQLIFIKIEVSIYKDRCVEIVEGAAVLLGWSACAAGSVNKSAHAAHLQQLILLRRSDILQYLGQHLGAHAFLDGLEYTKGIGNGWFAHVDNIALLHHVRRLEARTVLGDAAILACVGSNGACLEYARCPQPFVKSCLHYEKVIG